MSSTVAIANNSQYDYISDDHLKQIYKQLVDDMQIMKENSSDGSIEIFYSKTKHYKTTGKINIQLNSNKYKIGMNVFYRIVTENYPDSKFLNGKTIYGIPYLKYPKYSRPWIIIRW